MLQGARLCVVRECVDSSELPVRRAVRVARRQIATRASTRLESACGLMCIYLPVSPCQMRPLAPRWYL